MSDRSVTPEGEGRDGRSPLPDAGPAPIHASVAPKGHQVGLKLQDQSGYSIAFKVKSTTKFAKIMDTWANKVGVEKKALRFLFDGTRLVEDDTPGSQDMADGDIIDVLAEQLGGGLAAFS